MRPVLATLLSALALLALPATALAACPQTSVGDLEDEVQCLECGVPLALATESPQANRQRALIARLADSCRSKEQVKEALVAEFGPRVITTPQNQGFDLVAWLLPAVALLTGAAALLLSVRRWRRGGRREDEPVDTPARPDPVRGRLDADLERYDL